MLRIDEMSIEFKTEQENFWAGNFGNEYNVRNQDQNIIASNIDFFSRALTLAKPIHSVTELGANVGLNLHALRALYPTLDITAVEINNQACQQLQKVGNIDIHQKSLLDYISTKPTDLAFFKGVLIHINPESLEQAYQVVYDSSKKYILIAEYYNPSPVSIPYRGHKEKLFKRDFAGEMLEKYPDLKLIDYGFIYHRDHFSQDDLTWFLLGK